MSNQKPLWEVVKEIEERMSGFSRQAITSSVMTTLAHQSNMALSLWSQADITHHIMEATDWPSDRYSEAWELAGPIWADIKDELSDNLNDFAMLEPLNVADRIRDMLKEEGHLV